MKMRCLVTTASLATLVASTAFAGVNADTVDGLHASAFAPAVHSHANYQTKFAQVVTVAKSGGDFTGPIAAMASIQDASAQKPYLVKIMPGVYDLGTATLSMKPFVEIEGAGELATTITGAATPDRLYPWTGPVLAGASNAAVRSLTIENTATPTGNDCSVAVTCVGASFSLSDVTVRVTSTDSVLGVGIWLNAGSTLTLENSSVLVDARDDTYGMIVSDSAANLTGVTINANASAGGGYGYIGNMSNSVIKDSSIAFNAANWGFGMYLNDGTTALTDVNIVSGRYGLYVAYCGTTPPQVTVDRSTIQTLIPASYEAVTNVGQSTVRIGNTKIIGLVRTDGGAAAPVCVGAYNGEYLPLNTSCQPQ